MWNWLIYAALAAGTLAVLAALAFLAVRVLRAWRDLKRLRRHLAKELDRLADRTETLADSAARAGDTTQLQERLDHLRATLAQFAVLREAFDEATATVTSVTAFMPRK
jgi:prefoldin subunit 5